MTLSTSGINQTEAAGTNIFMAKVGLGTNAPAEQLHVRGNFRVDGTNIVTALQLGNGEPRTEWPPSGDGSLTWSGSNQWDNSTKAVARTNLGLGTAATLDSSAFASSSDLSTHLGDTGNPHVVNAAQVGALSTSGNLSELANAATARSNLGLGSAATLNATNFLTPNGGVINGTLSTIAPCGDIPVGVYTNY